MIKKIFIFVLIIVSLFGCANNEEKQFKEEKVTVMLPDWKEKCIASPRFIDWGSIIIQNQNYYFYATGKGIMRIEKSSNKEDYIVKSFSQKMLLCMGENCLYYVIPEEKSLYQVGFSGENNKRLICGNDIKDAKLEYPDLLGVHVYKESVYLLLGGYELCVLDSKGKNVKHIADNVCTDSGGFYNNYFYYGI